VLLGLARDVAHARTDLIHFPMIYYFATRDAGASLSRWTRHLCRLACEGLSTTAPEPVRLAAGVLDASLTDLAKVLVERFVDVTPGDREAAFEAFAADYRIERA
jgi:hypothetical protein